ncbi:MAG TPA: hypothetical protein VG497_19615 [Kribbella sp.]|nr:hypothetical protein [Kribbella sp.]
MIITAASFPTPDLVKVTNNPAQWDQQEAFAKFQAAAANESLSWLNERLDAATTRAERRAAFGELYGNLADWRFEIAQRSGGASPDAELDQYRRSIGPDDSRLSVFGPGLRSEGGGQIDHGARKLTEGVPTPGSRQSVRIGEIIQARFEAEAPHSDVLQNAVTLTDGQVIRGNLLLRGKAAAESRGVLFALEGLCVTRTGTQADRRRLQQEAFDVLAGLEERRGSELLWDPDARHAFVQAQYFLYQGPEYERGGDAMIRTLLVAAHARVFDQPVRMLQDVDVRAHSMGQADFTRYAVDGYSLAPGGGSPEVSQQVPAPRPQQRQPGVERG